MDLSTINFYLMTDQKFTVERSIQINFYRFSLVENEQKIVKKLCGFLFWNQR
jgi:hypothetical protein